MQTSTLASESYHKNRLVDSDAKCICILARKRLKYNSRIVRQAKALSDVGYKVIVAAIGLPSNKMMSSTPNVRYIEIEVPNYNIGIKHILILFSVAILKTFQKKNITNSDFVGKKINYKLRLLEYFERQGLICKGIYKIRSILNIKLNQITKYKNISLLRYPIRIIKRLLRYPIRIIKFTKKYINHHLLKYRNIIAIKHFSYKCKLILKNEKISICQAHDSYALQAAKNLSLINGSCIIYDAVEAPDQRSGKNLVEPPAWISNRESKIDENIIKSADIVFTVGRSLAEWTAQRYIINMPIVVSNCCQYRSINQNHMIRNDINLQNGEKIALILGSIYEDQGIDKLIESLPYLDRNIHIAILGPSTQIKYYKILKEKIEKLHNNERVHILPVQEQQNVIDYISGADIGIIALQKNRLNHELALPNKFFEYVMARLPIACGRLENISFLIEKHNIGNTFDETNPMDIAKNINNMLQSRNITNLNKSLEIASKKLCWEMESKKYVEAIDNLFRKDIQLINI